jgi:hypothetical protein
MSWFKVRWTTFGRVGAAVLLTVLPAAQQARAQSSGTPQEQTVAQLRATLEGIIGDDRQRQLLGIPPEGIDDVAIGLLEADFDENVQPGLDFAEKDCFFAEVPVGKALSWARQVQLLGYAENMGPLWLEADIVQESLLKILKHCHKQMYEACVLDDGDPNAALLPGVTRQLSLMDGDPIYEEKSRRCSVGWHGTLSSSESLQGTLSRTVNVVGGTATTTVILSGSRDLKIELSNKVADASGSVDGRVAQNRMDVGKSAKCTTTIEVNALKTSTNSGAATLRKHSSEAGALTISWGGPNEKGTTKTTGRTTYSDSKCGTNVNMPNLSGPVPSFAWPGQINDTLGDPYAEVITGTRTVYWVINSSGAAVSARAGDDGGVARIPGIPGAAVPAGASALRPWLSLVQPISPDLEGEPPTIKMDINWSLVFGEV